MPNAPIRFPLAELQRANPADWSGISILNTDTTAQDTDADDPFEYALAAAPGKVRIAQNPGLSYFTPIHFISGNTAPGAGAVARFYGFIPDMRKAAAELVMPVDINATQFNDWAEATLGGGIWIPLLNTASPAAKTVDFGTAIDVHKNSVAGGALELMIQTGLAPFYCGNVALVAGTIHTAATLITAGILGVQFHGPCRG